MKQIDIASDIYEAAVKIAANRHDSVKNVIEEILREKIGKKPSPEDIIGAFKDDPEAIDRMMEFAMQLRERPLRMPND